MTSAESANDPIDTAQDDTELFSTSPQPERTIAVSAVAALFNELSSDAEDLRAALEALQGIDSTASTMPASPRDLSQFALGGLHRIRDVQSRLFMLTQPDDPTNEQLAS